MLYEKQRLLIKINPVPNFFMSSNSHRLPNTIADTLDIPQSLEWNYNFWILG